MKEKSFGRDIRRIVIREFPEIIDYKKLGAELDSLGYQDLKQSSIESYRNDSLATLRLISADDLRDWLGQMREPEHIEEDLNKYDFALFRPEEPPADCDFSGNIIDWSLLSGKPMPALPAPAAEPEPAKASGKGKVRKAA